MLTSEDIDRAKQLRRDGMSNRKIALFFGVGKTTIWENVFAESRRIKINRPQAKKVPDLRPSCLACEIRLTRNIQTYHDNPVSMYQIPANFQMGSLCLGCYLKSKGLTHVDLVGN